MSPEERKEAVAKAMLALATEFSTATRAELERAARSAVEELTYEARVAEAFE